MRYTEPDQPGSEEVVQLEETTEEHLRRENEELRRKLLEQQHARVESAAHPAPAKPPHPTRIALWLITLGLVALIVVAFFAGYLPRLQRETQIRTEAKEQVEALPRVNVVPVTRSGARTDLVLPGSIQAVTEAPILARADGYIKTRLVDIGDHVKTGQLVAEIEAPELDQQVVQARANLQETHAALDQADANYQQGKANTELAGVTARRWSNLASKGVVSRQENDQYQAQYQAQAASLQSLEKAIAAAHSNVASSEANLARLEELQSYKLVRAPFDGVITLRNVDVGALITAGNTLLFRVAQTNVLRTYVNVPQTNAGAIHVGQAASLTVSNLPERRFPGTVARTSNSLDPGSRTLLVEVQVRNTDGSLLPGMYTDVDLNSSRADPPLRIPGDALVMRSDGPQVALVPPDHVVHFQRIDIGRDFGDHLEVSGGLADGDLVIPNPSDAIREGVKVNPILQVPKPAAQGAGK
jgi:RND family efflux transporter MFP subunit